MGALARWVGRAIGLDVHRDFCEVAICEDGKTRSAGRVPSTPEGIRSLADSLLAPDLRRHDGQWHEVGKLDAFKRR